MRKIWGGGDLRMHLSEGQTDDRVNEKKNKGTKIRRDILKG